jgi:hypothetical protein
LYRRQLRQRDAELLESIFCGQGYLS